MSASAILKKKPVIVVCVVLGTLLLAAILGAAMLGVAFYGIARREVRPEEKRMLVSVDDLAQFANIPGDRSKCESYLAKTNLDGSLELEYAYDTDVDPAADGYLYFKSEAEISSSPDEASESFKNQIRAYKAGAALVSGRSLEDAQQLFTSGDQNYAVKVMQDGEVIGNIVVALKGKVVHSFLVFGLEFDQPEDLESLLGPKLRAH